jgi:hypothetical protein
MINTIMQRAGIPAGVLGETPAAVPQGGAAPKIADGTEKSFKSPDGQLVPYIWKEGVGWTEKGK